MSNVISLPKRWKDEMTVSEAAEYLREVHQLKMSEKTFRKRLYLTNGERIPHEKRPGNRLIFKKSELDAWVRRGTEVRKAY